MLIYHAKLEPMDAPARPDGFLQMEGGRIAALGDMAHCPPPGPGDVDARGALLLPGLVDAHCHLGLFPDGTGYAQADCAETGRPAMPQLRALDGINPLDPTFREALAAGITTAFISPGSAVPIGGQIAAVKTAGRWIDQMAVKAPAAIKLALGENPKSSGGFPATRMGTAALIREALTRARDYGEALAAGKRPDWDPALEALAPAAMGQLPVHIHAHRADDIATAVRIAEEFRLRCVLLHGTEGYLVADLLAEKGIPVVVGPVITDRSKPELAHMLPENAARLAGAGVKLAICTDHPELPAPYLAMSAALCMRHGLAEDAALRAITLGAAEIGGIAHRTGSLTPGKDGDVTLWSGSPLNLQSRVLGVWVDGVRKV